MKQNIQQRPISPLGESSIRVVVRKYDPQMDHAKMMFERTIFFETTHMIK